MTGATAAAPGERRRGRHRAAGSVPRGTGDPGGAERPDETDARAPKVRLARMAGLAGPAVSETGPRREPRAGGATGAGRLVERWMPPGVPLGRAARGRRLAWTAVLTGVVAVGVVVTVLTADRPQAEPAPPLPVVRDTPEGSGTPTAGTGGTAEAGDTGGARPDHGARSGSAPSAGAPSSLVVSVVGEVADPGLVTLPPGARVADAIERAGGAEEGTDLHTVNLARELADGEQIHVGVPAPPGVRTGSAPATGAGPADAAPVNLNTADREALEALPGVGEVTAGRVLDWRARHGRFTVVEQLREVDGIGRKRFARLRDMVTVG